MLPARALPAAAPVAAPHEHALRLVQVDYDDSGVAVSEFSCTSCGEVWFE